jgi:autotransporter-associated beta strand protein
MTKNNCRLGAIAYWLCAIGSFLVGPAAAQTLPGPVTVITSFPLPAADAFVTNMRFGPDGLMYAWDGQHVWQQSGVNVDSFGAPAFGTVPSSGADAGPINFSQNGQTILIGNGAGGNDFSGASGGLLYTMPATGGAATLAGTLPFHQDLIPAPSAATMPNSATKFIVDRGSADFATSGVDLFDFTTGKVVPLIQNIPGASSSIAFDAANRLYVGIGYGPQRGQIRRFALPLVDFAAAGKPLDWTAGQLFNATDNNSGGGMFFDARGNLFAGGPDGVTVFNASGAGQLYGTGPSTFPVVMHNSVNDQFSLTLNGVNDPMNLGFSPRIYRTDDFGVPALAAVSWNGDAGGNWSDGSRWSKAAPPNGIDQVATLAGSVAGPVTVMLDVPVTLGTLTLNGPHSYRLSGPNALTMQVSGTIAAINVGSGNHEIAAPFVLASSSDITVANSADILTIGGGISGSGMLSKEGNGTLAITGPNTYTGNTAIDAGRLRFQIASGSPTVATGMVVIVAPGATLELAGTISALADASGNRAQIVNDSTAAGIIVSGANQVVGAIDGCGRTTINAGGDLTADHISQSALLIGGTAADPAKLTIAPASDGLSIALIANLAPPGPLGEGLDSTGAFSGPAGFDFSSAPSWVALAAEPNSASVPEPTSLALALTTLVALLIRRMRRWKTRPCPNGATPSSPDIRVLAAAGASGDETSTLPTHRKAYKTDNRSPLRTH